MRSYTAALLLAAVAAASTVLAGPIFFTQPTPATVWTAGQQVQIYWQGKDGNSATLANAPLSIDLVYGNSNAVQSLGTLVKACSEKDAKVVFTLPANLPSGNLYGLRAGSAYSPQFTISGPGTAGSSFPAFQPATVKCAGDSSGAESLTSSAMSGLALAAAAYMMA